jgi:hypothetical protein
LPDGVRATLGTDPSRPCFNLFLLKPLPAGDLTLPQPLALVDVAAEFRAQVLETREFLPVRRDSSGHLVITIPAALAGIDHPVIRVGPADSLPALYEDGTPITPMRPGRMHD